MNKYSPHSFHHHLTTHVNTTVLLQTLSCHTIDNQDTVVADTVDVLTVDVIPDTHDSVLEKDSLVATEHGDSTNALRFHIHSESTDKST